tara:strand:- start:303 stop:485 length:183 start_codon:yes stop_codon:yes gene_type:complete
MIDKELIMLILMPIIIFGIVKPYLDKRREKKDKEQLSNRLHNVENNVTQLTNVKYKRRFK